MNRAVSWSDQWALRVFIFFLLKSNRYIWPQEMENASSNNKFFVYLFNRYTLTINLFSFSASSFPSMAFLDNLKI